MSDESQASKSHLYILGLHSLSSSIAGTGQRPVLIVCLWTKSRSYFRNRKIAPESQWVFASGCCCGAVRREGAEQSRSLPKFVYFDLSLVVVSSMSSIASRYTYPGYTISSHSLDCLIQGPLSSFSSSRRCSAPHNLIYNQVTLDSLEQLVKVVSYTNRAQQDRRALKPSGPKRHPKDLSITKLQDPPSPHTTMFRLILPALTLLTASTHAQSSTSSSLATSLGFTDTPATLSFPASSAVSTYTNTTNNATARYIRSEWDVYHERIQFGSNGLQFVQDPAQASEDDLVLKVDYPEGSYSKATGGTQFYVSANVAPFPSFPAIGSTGCTRTPFRRPDSLNPLTEAQPPQLCSLITSTSRLISTMSKEGNYRG